LRRTEAPPSPAARTFLLGRELEPRPIELPCELLRRHSCPRETSASGHPALHNAGGVCSLLALTAVPRRGRPTLSPSTVITVCFLRTGLSRYQDWNQLRLGSAGEIAFAFGQNRSGQGGTRKCEPEQLRPILFSGSVAEKGRCHDLKTPRKMLAHYRRQRCILPGTAAPWPSGEFGKGRLHDFAY
jgi:hypothetical protein